MGRRHSPGFERAPDPAPDPAPAHITMNTQEVKAEDCLIQMLLVSPELIESMS